MEKALVIIPTYNERDNIGKVLEPVLGVADRIEVLIVDDNSPDGTGELADNIAASNPRVHVLHRKGKLGLGSAYREGFRYALEHDYELVFEMDADFSHDPRFLPDFLEAVKDNDLVIGSRYVSGVNVVNWPMRRLLLSYGASFYTRAITGMPIKDPTGGFKCFRRRVLESLDLNRICSDGYSFQIEVNFKVWRKKFRIKEIPIVFTERATGESKMSKKIVREAIWKVWKLRILDLFGKL